MTMVAELRTTTSDIGKLEITRRGNDYSCEPDSVHRYIVRLDGREIGHVNHRYGDGAWSLLHKATELVITNQAGPDPQAPRPTPRGRQVLDTSSTGYL